MDDTNTKFNIKEGTVSFRTREGAIIWNDGKAYTLFETSSEGNSIFILKDSDNKLKFFHVYIGHGRTDVEYDVASLSIETKHFIAATWSVSQQKIMLYVDGALVAEKNIEYQE